MANEFVARKGLIISGSTTSFKIEDLPGSGTSNEVLVRESDGTIKTKTNASSSGSSGTSGNDGSSGSSGTSGANGSSGSSGTSGANGSSGSSGTSGANGSSGSSGSSGTSGANGAPGSSGSSGTSGANGAPGSSGSSGSSGTSGANGSSGSSGSSGTSGANGSSGSSGTSGANGSSGSSGSSGADGSLTLTGTTDNGVITLNGTAPNATVESNLTFDGSKLLVSGSGSTIFEVIGSEGQLFSITDSLSGSLFAVSDVSGLPILEVFSDDKIVGGTFNSNTFVVTGSQIGIGHDSPSTLLHISGSAPLRIEGLAAGSESLFLTVDSNGVVKTNTAGAAGSSGSSGSSGTSGNDGSPGSSGSSGTSGTNGAPGSSGSSGTSGANGAPGSSGSSGSSGTSGNDGSPGSSGSSGTSGTNGAPGSSGSSGTSGANGAPGSSGSSGSSGTSGANGAPGSSGSSGTSGSNGAPGSSGSSGTSGANGSSGTSGQSPKSQYLYTYNFTTSTGPTPGPGNLTVVDDVIDYVVVNTSSLNNVDLDGASPSNDFNSFLFDKPGSILTLRETSSGAFKSWTVLSILTGNNGNGADPDVASFQIQYSVANSSGSLNNGDTVEFIWDQSAGVGDGFSRLSYAFFDTAATIYKPAHNFIDIFYVPTTSPPSGVPSPFSDSGSFTQNMFLAPAISQSANLTINSLESYFLESYIYVKAPPAAAAGSVGKGARIITAFPIPQSLNKGDLYYWSGSGEWDLANASSESTATGFLIMAIDSNGEEILKEGLAYPNTSLSGYGVGEPVYLSTTSGKMTQNVPTGSGEIVRIVGHVIDSARNTMYFNPSNDWIEIA